MASTESTQLRQAGSVARQHTPRRRGPIAPYLLLAPALLLLGTVLMYPLGRGVALSFTDTSLLNPNGGKFVGLDNYQAIIESDSALTAAGLTLFYAAASVAGALAVGLGVALLIHGQGRRRAVLRSLIILPWATPPIAVALIFAWIFNNQYGVVNYVLVSIGWLEQPVNWLDDSQRALPAVIVVTTWMTFPIVALIILAALQSVPADLYEAARIDGAGPLNIYSNVTWPGIRPTVYVVTLLLSIWALRRFDILWVLTRGGPGDSTSTLVVRLYREAFDATRLGYASAIGVVGLVLSIAVTVVYFFVSRTNEDRAK